MKSIVISALFLVLISCTHKDNGADAYGNFEAREIIVSAEGNGKILQLDVSLGEKLMYGDQTGLIDTSQLYFSREQLLAKKASLKTKLNSIEAQLAVLNAEKKNILIEKSRIENLLEDGAATKAQLDNISGKLDVTNARIESVQVEKQTINAESAVIEAQIKQVEDQLMKCRIINPTDGTVLEKYVEPGEITASGKPLYKIADLELMELKAYISGAQLDDIKLGQDVQVFIDKTENENQQLTGKVAWISGQAEFTPKIIQTKDMRVDLVYAIKVHVSNDGRIKIGMPGEVKF